MRKGIKLIWWFIINSIDYMNPKGFKSWIRFLYKFPKAAYIFFKLGKN